MKRMLWLLFSLLLISSVALADHIGIYSDATGTSCSLVPGFSTTATVIHKFASGAVGSDFNLAFPPGTSFFSFNSPYYICGIAGCPEPFSLAYGQCRAGNIVLGTINAIYGTGTAQVVHSNLFANIQYTDCSFAFHSATGGSAYVGTTGNCDEPLPVEPSTWGSVKSLYR